MQYEVRYYLELIKENASPSIAEQGWSDGFFGKPEDCFEIIKQLYKIIKKDELIVFLSLYLQGYEVGLNMNENYEIYYDENGEIKEQYEGNIEPLFDHINESVDYINKYEKLIFTNKKKKDNMKLKELYELTLIDYKVNEKKEKPDKLLAMLLLQEMDKYEPIKTSEGNFYLKYKKQIDEKIAIIENDFDFDDGEYIEIIEEKGYWIKKFDYDKIWLLYAKGFGALHWGLVYRKELSPEQIYEKYFCENYSNLKDNCEQSSIVQLVQPEEQGTVKKLLPNNNNNNN